MTFTRVGFDFRTDFLFILSFFTTDDCLILATNSGRYSRTRSKPEISVLGSNKNREKRVLPTCSRQQQSEGQQKACKPAYYKQMEIEADAKTHGSEFAVEVF